MRKSRTLTSAMVVLWLLAAPAGLAQNGGKSKYTPVAKYDPQRNADADIQAAVKEAQRTHRRILLEVGGLWCSWCRTLDNFFETHRELLQLREASFVTVKINFSPENENKEVLSRYPAIEAYPHLLVLDSEGKFLHSQGTGVLESGHSYDLGRLTGFLKTWA